MFLQTTTHRGEKLPQDSSEERARGTPKIQLPIFRNRTLRKMKNNLTSVKTLGRGPWTDDQ